MRLQFRLQVLTSALLLMTLASCKGDSSARISGPPAGDVVSLHSRTSDRAASSSITWNVEAGTVTTASGRTIAAPKRIIDLLEQSEKKHVELSQKLDERLSDPIVRSQVLRVLDGKRVVRLRRGEDGTYFNVDAESIRSIVAKHGAPSAPRSSAAAIKTPLSLFPSVPTSTSGLDGVISGPLPTASLTLQDCNYLAAAAVGFYVLAEYKQEELIAAIASALADDYIDQQESEQIDALQHQYDSLYASARNAMYVATACYLLVGGSSGGGGTGETGASCHWEWVEVDMWDEGSGWGNYYSGWILVCEYAQ